MDSQSSTAPLLRQLDSIHRQNRARASAWAELETKLRTELEENVIANEKLSRERSDLKTKCNRFERTANELEGELKATKISLDEKSVRVKVLEEKLADMETEGAKMKEEWAEVERLANEGVSRVRSEMTVTVVENEERHRSQLDALEAELRQERDRKAQSIGRTG
jgi:septal ring factor EnvC (AmiA/AmiB activator)